MVRQEVFPSPADLFRQRQGAFVLPQGVVDLGERVQQPPLDGGDGRRLVRERPGGGVWVGEGAAQGEGSCAWIHGGRIISRRANTHTPTNTHTHTHTHTHSQTHTNTHTHTRVTHSHQHTHIHTLTHTHTHTNTHKHTHKHTLTAHTYLHRDRYECTDGVCCRVRTWHLSDGLYGVGGTP